MMGKEEQGRIRADMGIKRAGREWISAATECAGMLFPCSWPNTPPAFRQNYASKIACIGLTLTGRQSTEW